MTLAALKAKWFLPMTGHVLGVPQTRHTPGATPQLSVSTDGNTVTPLIDGKAYMNVWQQRVLALTGVAGGALYHSGWQLDRLQPSGVGVGTDTVQDLAGAVANGASVRVLLSAHVSSLLVNPVTVGLLTVDGVSACLDTRFHSGVGSIHQKMAVFKLPPADDVVLMGSIDLEAGRWDDPDHLPSNLLRPGKPSHDLGVAIQGPAVNDFVLTFRERWNDSSRTFGMWPAGAVQPVIPAPGAAPPGSGTHSVQVLRTYAMGSHLTGYSWSSRGEFTLWASYLNAIQTAQNYIYIEDQYLIPAGYSPRFARAAGDAGREADIFFQLGKAIQNGITVIILVPNNSEDKIGRDAQYHQRNLGINYLHQIAGSGGGLVVGALSSGGTDVYVHSKVMLVDDEFALVGSGNFCQRSMTNDDEVHIGVVDGAQSFVKDLRKKLWSEHTGLPQAALDDPAAAIGLFETAIANDQGHLASYALTSAPQAPRWKRQLMLPLIDPYGGPPGLD